MKKVCTPNIIWFSINNTDINMISSKIWKSGRQIPVIIFYFSCGDNHTNTDTFLHGLVAETKYSYQTA